MDKEAEFLKRLLATFKLEAEEHLKEMESGLLKLEKVADTEVIETIFREVHSLKGAARAVSITDIESLCQALENVFAIIKKSHSKPSIHLFDLLHSTVDFLGKILPRIDEERTKEEKETLRNLVKELDGVNRKEILGREVEAEIGLRHEEKKLSSPISEQVSEQVASSEPLVSLPQAIQQESFQKSDLSVPENNSTVDRQNGPPISPQGQTGQHHAYTGTETIRVTTAKLSALFLQSEELLSAKLAAGQRVVDLRSATNSFAQWRKEWRRIAPSIEEQRRFLKSCQLTDEPALGGKVRIFDNLLDFMEWNGIFVKGLEERFAREAKAAERDRRALGGMVGNLLEEAKKVLMFPFSSLLEILPRIVRDLARDSGKEIDLEIVGGEIEVDRRILEEMKDPLVHLIRNCVDHGIELPSDRLGKGKPKTGVIRVEAFPKDDKVEVRVSDDGAGINLSAIRSALIKMGTMSREKVDELGTEELISFVFQSGVSTSQIITEISGRGIGMAIVNEKVEKLGGTVSIESTPDRGTSFRILLPLTVATFRGILVRVSARTFVVPTMHVERVLLIHNSMILTVENRETIEVKGVPLSLVRLADILELPAAKKKESSGEQQKGIILSAGGLRIAFMVDEVLHEQEILHKSLGHQLARVPNISGATVLGNMEVAPILNVSDLVKSAVKLSARSTGSGAGTVVQESHEGMYSVMVVEDSITTRTLLKNILESSGYNVVTAVDGVDAFGRLKAEKFDILVSDVEMPRMNGFELTAKIRADKGMGDMPVVLVTALESREDKEKGIDVGANAYIVKGSFDQSNLLSVIKSLL